MPGVDYALTEVVHCGSQHEVGVAEAFSTCVDRYFERVLNTAAAMVVICVGGSASEAFKRAFGVDPHHHTEPAEIAGRRRFIVSVPHPGRFGTQKSLEPYVGSGRLAQVREALRQEAVRT